MDKLIPRGAQLAEQTGRRDPVPTRLGKEPSESFGEGKAPNERRIAPGKAVESSSGGSSGTSHALTPGARVGRQQASGVRVASAHRLSNCESTSSADGTKRPLSRAQRLRKHEAEDRVGFDVVARAHFDDAQAARLVPRKRVAPHVGPHAQLGVLRRESECRP